MSEAAKMRMQRINRLISELEYEITRGVMEREIEPDFHFCKLLPCHGRGDNLAKFEMHLTPARKDTAPWPPAPPRLRLVD